jgi:PAS domain S-box-containing protein
LKVATPVLHHRQLVGNLYLGVSNQPVAELRSSARTGAVFTGIVVFVVTIAMVIAISTAVTSPLKTVRETVLRVQAGDFSRRTGLTAEDEIGEVGKAFDVMMDRLQDAYTRLEQVNRTLEQRVAIRTRELQEEVDEHKETELSLRRSEELFRQLAENVREVFWIRDLRSDEIVYVSPAFEDVWGIPRKQLNLSDAEFPPSLHAEDRERVWESQANAKNGSRMSDEEYRIVLPDGSVRWIRSRMFPIYDREGKLYRVAGLAEDHTERRLKDDTLRASLREKEILLKEVHHRVKNNLQVISSLLNLQAMEIGDPTTRELFRESQHRVRSMATVHERLYRSGNFAQIDFGEYLESVTRDLTRAFRREGVSCTIRADRVLLPIDTAIPCGLIVNELVSNALKHAFSDGEEGIIEVELRARPNREVELIVRDNGRGFPADKDFRSMASMGMNLVLSLTEQICGTIDLDRSGGTRFRIVFSA